MRMTRIATCILAAGALAAIEASAAPYVVLMNGTTNVGVSITRKLDQSVVLTLEGGKVFTYAKDQVKAAVADMPPEYTKAVQALSAGKPDEAIALCEGVISNLRGLHWDNQARRIIAYANKSKNKFGEAVTAIETAFRESPELKSDEKFMGDYCTMLIAAGQYEKVGTELDKLVASGSRPMAARAQVLRGDMRVAQGLADQAILDYMRTVILFENEKETRGEAMFKAAELLEKRKDRRAPELYRRIKEEYAGTSLAQKAAAKVGG